MTRKVKPYPLLNSERTVLRGCLKVLKDWGLSEHIRRQNVGAFANPAGQIVRFGHKGDSDLGGVLPEWFGRAAGKRIVIEVKREGFKPPNYFVKAREHWVDQLANMDRVNKSGGYGFWCDDSEYLWKSLDLISHGYRVRIGTDERPEFYLDGAPS